MSEICRLSYQNETWAWAVRASDTLSVGIKPGT